MLTHQPNCSPFPPVLNQLQDSKLFGRELLAILHCSLDGFVLAAITDDDDFVSEL